MDARLSPEQLADLRRSPERPLKDLARDLGVDKAQAAALVEQLEILTPLWVGRESARLVLGVGGLLLFLVTLLSYGSNTSGGFLFDDVHSIHAPEVASLRVWMRQNVRETDPLGHKLSNLGEGFSRSLDDLFSYNRFRVVTYATFAVQDWLYDEPAGQAGANGGLTSENPAAPEPHVHSFNNAIHALNAVLAMCFAYLTFTAPVFRTSSRALRYPAWGAVLTGAVFALHPLQTQAVTYVSQRAESLGTTFFLATLCALIWARQRSQDPRFFSDEDEAQPGSVARPYLTVLVWAGLLGAAGLIIIAAAKGVFLFSSGCKVLLGLTGLAAAATTYFVKRGWDEPWHASAVGLGFLCFILGLETKEIVGVLPMVILLWELIFGRAPEGARQSQGEASGDDENSLSPSLLPPGPSLLQRAWGWRALRGFARAETLRYQAPWVAGVALVLLAFPLVGGNNFWNQFLSAEGVAMGGRQDARITPANYLLTQANVAHTYVRLAALPVGQNVDHDYPLALEARLGKGPEGPLVERIGDLARPLAGPGESSAFTTLLSLGLIFGGLALAFVHGGRARIPTFSLGLALLVLAPSSSLVVLADVIFEHRFYLPLLGGALLLPVLLERGLRALDLPAPRAVLVQGGVVLLTVVVGAVLVHQRNAVWQNNDTLWSDVTQKSPRKPRGWVNLGLHWQKIETHLVEFRTPQGQTQQQRCVRVELPGGEDLLLLQNGYQVGQPQILPAAQVVSVRVFVGLEDAQERARSYYRSALGIEPYGKALNNLAIISVYRYQHLAQERQAIKHSLLPRFTERGDAARVEACEARLKAIEPLLDAAAAEAERCLLTRIAMKESDFFTLNNLGGLYSMTSQHSRSIGYLRAALALDDHEEMTWAGLGEAYEKWGLTRHVTSLRQENDPDVAARWARLARESWTEALRAYRTFLEKMPDAPQSGYVRKSIARIEGWLAGRGLPDARTPLPRTATIE